jgi:hypothetical protein
MSEFAGERDEEQARRSTPEAAPRPVPGPPTTRTWVLWAIWRVVLIAISVTGVVMTDGWRRWLWLALLTIVLLTTWFFRPGRSAGVRVPAALSQPGDHRVVLQLPGDKPVHVVAALRRITGADLVTAKAMLQGAPVVVAENLSQESAAQAAHLLESAGARAVVSPMDGSP